MRLVDPDSGAVLIDDIDLREVRRGGVTEVAALVAQQTFMFDDSVRGNITLGADARRRERSGAPCTSPRAPASSSGCPTASTPASASAAPASPAASASGSPWPAP